MQDTVDNQSQLIFEVVKSDPYAIAAWTVFNVGAIFLYILSIVRHNMTPVGAALALIGVKRVPKRDKWFNLVVWGVISLSLVLFVIAFQSNAP